MGQCSREHGPAQSTFYIAGSVIRTLLSTLHNSEFRVCETLKKKYYTVAVLNVYRLQEVASKYYENSSIDVHFRLSAKEKKSVTCSASTTQY
jgi:hypothetical protein